jgi:hypothetical protein
MSKTPSSSSATCNQVFVLIPSQVTQTRQAQCCMICSHVSAEVLKYWIDSLSLSLSTLKTSKSFESMRMVIANWVQLHTCMILFVFYLFVCLSVWFDAQYWCWVFGWIFFTWWPQQKKGDEGALTHTKVIIVWPYLAKSSSCGWSSPVHLPTKWGEKKTLNDDDDDGKCNDKILYSYILFILYRPSVVSMCFDCVSVFSLWLDFRCVGSATVWDTTTSQGILCSTNRLDFWKNMLSNLFTWNGFNEFC